MNEPEKTTKQVAAMNQFQELVSVTFARYKGLKLDDPTNKQQADVIIAARKDLKNVRLKIQRASKEQQAPLKELIAAVKKMEDDLVSQIKPLEYEFMEQQKMHEAWKEGQARIEQERIDAIFKNRIDLLDGLEFYQEDGYIIKRHDPTTDMDEREMSIGLADCKDPDFDFNDFLEKAMEFHNEVLTAREKRDRALRKEARIAELTRHGFTDDGTGYAYALCFRGDGEPCETISYDIIEKATDEVFNQELQSCLEARGDYQEEIAKQAKERAEKEAQDRVREVSAMRKKLLQKTLDKEQIEYFNDQKGLVELGTLSKQKFDELYDQASAYLGHVLAKRIPKMESIGWVVNMEKGQLESEDGNTIGLTWLRDLPQDKYDELIAPKPVEYEEGEEVLEAEDEPQAEYKAEVPHARRYPIPLKYQTFKLGVFAGTIVVDKPYCEEVKNHQAGYLVCGNIVNDHIAQAICDAWNEKHGL
jgi:hypothetical protein